MRPSNESRAQTLKIVLGILLLFSVFNHSIAAFSTRYDNIVVRSFETFRTTIGGLFADTAYLCPASLRVTCIDVNTACRYALGLQD